MEEYLGPMTAPCFEDNVSHYGEYLCPWLYRILKTMFHDSLNTLGNTKDPWPSHILILIFVSTSV